MKTYIIIQPKESNLEETPRPFYTTTKLGTEYPDHHILFKSDKKANCEYHCARAFNDPNYCVVLRALWMAQESASNVSDVKVILMEAIEEWVH